MESSVGMCQQPFSTRLNFCECSDQLSHVRHTTGAAVPKTYTAAARLELLEARTERHYKADILKIYVQKLFHSPREHVLNSVLKFLSFASRKSLLATLNSPTTSGCESVTLQIRSMSDKLSGKELSFHVTHSLGALCRAPSPYRGSDNGPYDWEGSKVRVGSQ
jgi:hypothetical protein